MKKTFLETIRCPLCKSNFALHSDSEKDNEILEGKLICSQCKEEFPIVNSVPNLLPPDLRL
ncbi:MAG TPA: methytransferase partner Trm112 [SAR202 cluster bacterium]|nr:methytransferase partner Trm112 [Dehalococcoidia bacterium]HJO60479.1 methytransferase partner Trm112 [SAR202 cluster bacterium]